MVKYNYSDISDGVCTAKQYTDQFTSVIPEVGKTYVQNPGQWNEHKFTILFVDDKIALGISKDSIMKGTIEYTMFYSCGAFAGWKYDDTARPSYRLQEIKD